MRSSDVVAKDQQQNRRRAPGQIPVPRDWRKTMIRESESYRATDPVRLAVAEHEANDRFLRQQRQQLDADTAEFERVFVRLLEKACDDQETEQRQFTGTRKEEAVDEPIGGPPPETRRPRYTETYFGGPDADARKALAHLAEMLNVNTGEARGWFSLLRQFVDSYPPGTRVKGLDPKMRDEFIARICRAAGKVVQ